MPVPFLVHRACARPVGSTGPGSVFGPLVWRHPPRLPRPRLIPLGRLVPVPTPPSDAFPTRPIVESARRPRQKKAPAPSVRPARPSARPAESLRREAAACAELASLPVRHEHAAGIDVGDASHWACVEATPDGSGTVREFPAHTPGLRELVAWLRQCGVTTVALEASGVYGHVPFLTLIEEGFATVMTSPSFTRQ